jgi:hypothetical protein
MASTETSKSIKLLNGGPLDGWWGPYANVAAACAAIPNTEALVDGVMVNFRQGKVVGIVTSEGIIKHSWNGIDFSNNGLKSDYGINYSTIAIPASSNFLNPSAVVLDKYVNSAGALSNADSNSIGLFAVTDFIPWGTNTQYIAGKNGAAYKLFTVAQFDASNVFIAGSYLGIDNVTGAISKVAGAAYFRATYKIANVNQLNFSSAILPFEAYYPSSVKKIGNADGNGNSATFNANLQDANLLAEFAKQAKTGGSDKTIADVLTEVNTKGINYTVVSTPESTNFLNPANILADKYVTSTGAIGTATDLGLFATLSFVAWGSQTQFIAGKNGSVFKLFSVAQYNALNQYIAGSFQGSDNVVGAVTKISGALSFHVTYKIADVNQLNWGSAILPYQTYFPAIVKKTAEKDGSNNSVTFKPNMEDAGLIAEFVKQAKTGGSAKSVQQIDAEKASKSQGVNYISSVSAASSNILNPALITLDKYVNAAGALASADSASLGLFAVTDFIPWGTNTQYIAGKNGSVFKLFTVAQYNASNVFLANSYAGIDNVNGAVTKVSGAVYFRASYKVASVNQINFGMAILPYEPYYAGIIRKIAKEDAEGNPATYKPDLTDLDLLGLITPVKTAENIVTPNTIYVQCNDLNKTNKGFDSKNFASILHADHMLDLSIRKKVNFRSTKSLILPVFAPIQVDNEVYNAGATILTTVISDVLEGDIIDTPFSFTRKSVLLSAVAGKFIASLEIADSTGEGVGSFYPLAVTNNNPAQSWAYQKRLNIQYKAQNGGVGFKYVAVGKRNSRTFVEGGTTYKAFAEGYGGWAVKDFLYNENGPYAAVNNFYDATKPGAVKFSLAKYLSRFRTMDDNGNRLSMSDPTRGTDVTNVNDWDVCTPTHITIQLSFNDVVAEFKTNIVLLIATIKSEFPNMIILLSIIDASGTLFPDKYPMFNYEGIDMLNDDLHRRMFAYVSFFKSLEDPANKVYLCPNYFIQPTAWGVATRDVNAPEYMANPIVPFMMQQEHGAGPNYHPNTYAHAAWAYQKDSLVKFTALQHL